MGIRSFFGSGKDQAEPLSLDLATFTVGGTPLGSLPSAGDGFAIPLSKSDVFEQKRKGIELGTREGALDYIFLSVAKFDGVFLLKGAPIEIGAETTEQELVRTFGEPYWVDRSDGEVILFYEYAAGEIELQFEFVDGESLGFITLSRDGVLSTEESRKSYGVTRPWPPA